MEPITVKSNLDLKTYYKISMKAAYTRWPMIVVFVLMLICISCTVYQGSFDLDVATAFMAWAGVFLILLPLLTWVRCKANMKNFPILAEGTDITVSEDSLECVSPSCSTKSNWSTIKKELSTTIILYY